ncbi:MAG: response regulator [Caldilineaceae bacterium]|nr:response regulator [Caldilineaceae bacterium]
MPKILIIEDEQTIRNEVLDWLQFEGFDVTGAENGRQGLSEARKDPPDLIVCDITMPELSGHDVLLEVRADPHLNRTPFIFLTASADRASVRRGMNMGADDYITKPFTHTELLTAIESQLGKQTQQAQQIQEQIETLNIALEGAREQSMLKSRLVAMFSHDFRNPLSSILSYSGLLRSYEDRLTPERKRQYLDRIDGAVHLLVQMIDEMLTVAEMESGHLDFAPMPVDLQAVMDLLLEEFSLIDQGAHQIVFENRLDSSFLKLDVRILRQVITNLVSNALKYSPAGSQVCIELAKDDGNLRIVVEDHGMGIPEESMKLLFDPFHRAANTQGMPGTGLGLSIVQTCVQRHEGQIDIASVLDQGTVATVRLPIAE